MEKSQLSKDDLNGIEVELQNIQIKINSCQFKFK